MREYTTGAGQLLYPIHVEDIECREYGCVIHAPSNHHMREWPTNWRGDWGFMERICGHGVGHPDPDDARYHLRHGRDHSVHGCDGCCSGENV